MRLFTLPFAFGLVIIFAFSSCKKYEDGPSLSFISKKERVVNDWQIKIAYSQDLNVTDDFDNVSIDIKSDGEFLITTIDSIDTLHYQEGLWDLVSENEEIRLLYTYPLQTPDRAYWKILRLKKDEMWVSTITDTTLYEFHLITR